MIVLFLLLLVGTAQAGDQVWNQVWDSIPPGCKLFQKGGGTVQLVCDGDDPIPLKEHACYQKMREAMRKMDDDLAQAIREQDAGLWWVLIAKSEHGQWNAAMKECVQ